jgi:hypothetical protein
MSDSSRAQLIFSSETLFNEVPVTPVMQKLRFNVEALKHNNATAVSAEIRPDRMRSDLVLLGIDVSGNVDAELSYGTYDIFLQAALCGTWTALSNTYADGVTTNSSPVFQSGSADFTMSDIGKVISTANYPVGTTIISWQSATQVTLSANATAGGTAQSFTIYQRQVTDGVTTSGSPNITSATANFTAADVGAPVSGAGITAGTTILSVTNATTAVLSANATASASSVRILIGNHGYVLNNGVTNRSFLIERGYADIGQYFQFRGCAVEEFNVDITARKIMMLTMVMMGGQATRSSASVSGSVTNSTTTDVMRAGTYITGISGNTNMTTLKARRVTFGIKNNMRAHELVTQLASDDFGRGVMDITGTIESYFNSGALFDQFIGNSATGFQFNVADPNGLGSYTFRFPKIKLADTDPGGVPGVDADVIQKVGYRGLFDPVTNCHMRVTR